jgi:hypothetical protein
MRCLAKNLNFCLLLFECVMAHVEVIKVKISTRQKWKAQFSDETLISVYPQGATSLTYIINEIIAIYFS